MFSRSAGILMHITSLPSPHGIGTMGKAAYEFVDFLAAARQTYWQVLPLGHSGFGESPYQCYSAAAGNPCLIDLDLLQRDGLLTAADLARVDRVLKGSDAEQVDFTEVRAAREPALRQAFLRVSIKKQQKIDKFTKKNRDWLMDYALFMALKAQFGDAPLWEWPDKAAVRRDKKALKHWRRILADEIAYYIFVQYEFFKQWNALHKYAHTHGIQMIGDLPIYVSPDSVDVWTNPALFKLQADLSPHRIAGVPPDYFSATGQLWGNPVYEWSAHAAQDYAWWIWRVRCNMTLFDIIRIDHFRGLESYWEVPAGEETAVNGAWRKGPGMKLMRAIHAALGNVPFIAEDLGVQTDKVRALLAESGYPGMRVLIFGFDPMQDSEHLPHNYVKNSIVYTSTHDSQTVVQQIEDICTEEERELALAYLRVAEEEPAGMCAIKSIYASPARVAMAAMQDVLSLGESARMNLPATVGGSNWRWRMLPGLLTPALVCALSECAQTYKRAAAVPEDEKPEDEKPADAKPEDEKPADEKYEDAKPIGRLQKL